MLGNSFSRGLPETADNAPVKRVLSYLAFLKELIALVYQETVRLLRPHLSSGPMDAIGPLLGMIDETVEEDIP